MRLAKGLGKSFRRGFFGDGPDCKALGADGLCRRRAYRGDSKALEG